MYGKVFRQIYKGTLASKGPWQALVTFQQFIVLADREGIVDMTAEAISRETTVPLDIILMGITALEEPDLKSRSPDEEGRRIVRLSDTRDWGWMITNYKYYRDLRNEEARKEYHRQYWHKRKKPQQNSTGTQHDSTNSTNAEADADVSKKKTEERSRAQRSSRIPPDFGMTPERRGYAEKLKLNPIAVMEAFVDYWNAASGANARKCDWEATWRTWCRRQGENWKSTKGQPVRSSTVDYESMEWREALSRGAAINFRKPWPMETPDSYTTAVKLEENRPPARDFSRVLKRVQA